MVIMVLVATINGRKGGHNKVFGAALQNRKKSLHLHRHLNSRLFGVTKPMAVMSVRMGTFWIHMAIKLDVGN
jgi:hypothetical protein